MNASHDICDTKDPMTPPPVPPSCVYTRCYCEENIYLLADALGREQQPTVLSQTQDNRTPSLWDPYVVFISNHQKTAALWNQKAREGVVVWDYHVILVLRPRSLRKNASANGETTAPDAWIYDFDTRCPLPCCWLDYMRQTFPYAFDNGWEIPDCYASLFRVIPAEEYLDNFVSDRSHMLDVQGQADAYLAEPPLYPPLCGKKVTDSRLRTNLMSSFVSMAPRPVLRVEHTSDGAREPAADIKDAQTYGVVLGMSGFLAWLSPRT